MFFFFKKTLIVPGHGTFRRAWHVPSIAECKKEW